MRTLTTEEPVQQQARPPHLTRKAPQEGRVARQSWRTPQGCLLFSTAPPEAGGRAAKEPVVWETRTEPEKMVSRAAPG